MAIDTEAKRKSVAAIAAPWLGPVIVPDSSIDSADRQAIGYSYLGIAAAAPTTSATPIAIPRIPLENANPVYHRRQIAEIANYAIGQIGTRGTFAKGSDTASASTFTVGEDGVYFAVTGTTNISSITVGAGRMFFLQFEGALDLVHSATLFCPGEADITTVAGDMAIFFATAPNTVRVMSYVRNTAP